MNLLQSFLKSVNHLIESVKVLLFNTQVAEQKITDKEIKLIKNTRLFNHVNPQQFEKVVASSKIIKFKANTLIFNIHEPPRTLYIMVSGCVDIHTRLNVPITLLHPGDYFSDRIISGQHKRSANINIKAVTDVVLLKIGTKTITPIEKVETSQQGPVSNEEIICTCLSVSRGQLQQLIDQGVRKISILSKETGACTMCQSCQYKILAMLGENPWIPAAIKEVYKHNESVYSYLIGPVSESYKLPLPGQHIIIQAFIKEETIERAFTLSDKYDAQSKLLRITVKEKPTGKLTPWLFATNLAEMKINITQPQGSFLLDMNEMRPAICFTAGIGITPFIAFAKGLHASQSKKKLHILYCEATEQNFIFKDEFETMRHEKTNFSISYWDIKKNGFLTEKKVIDLIKEFGEPDIYICGSERFEQFITKILKVINYNITKIHIEKFVLEDYQN